MRHRARNRGVVFISLLVTMLCIALTAFAFSLHASASSSVASSSISYNSITSYRRHRKPAPGITPERPSESGAPAIPPSHMDPGMQHMPERRGDPRGSVKPPNLDPGMSTNPDVAPPQREDVNPPGGVMPQGKPNIQ